MLDFSLAIGVCIGFFFVFVFRYLSQKHQESLEIKNGGNAIDNNNNNQVDTKWVEEMKKENEKKEEKKEEKKKLSIKDNGKPIKILYGTQTGTAKEWAFHLKANLKEEGFESEVTDLATFEPDELIQHRVVLFIISTYTDGKAPDRCVGFYDWLNDFSLDFRVPKTYFEKNYFSIFGIGDSIYGKNFVSTAKEINKMLLRLSANQIAYVGAGDNGTSTEIKDGYKPWLKIVLQSLNKIDLNATPLPPSLPPASKKQIKTSDELESDEEDEKEPLVDMEDMGAMVKRIPKKKQPKVQKIEEEDVEEDEEEEDDEEDEEDLVANGDPKEMLTESLRKSLTKQGYKLLGSHSGVKMCRWTKAMMRGRGGCYKHTFYGITSSQCMEMTPSLACANKCVFCWRHHKNPVGKEWRWVVDEPEMLVEEAIKNHLGMIKQFRGVPGVTKETFDEALTIRHCALSLVGEPIIYPHINPFIQMLHERNISSFMVTNAQFPDKIDSLDPVTQLYVSIDAGTKESLRKVDRPIFSDFWERFLGSIESLRKKGQRTVFRLTLIKEWNIEEIANYAELVERGQPTLIEIKGVTYCGTSKASTLTMKNVPYHQEVLRFSQMLCDANEFTKANYEIACEHEHSCCVLLANKRFKVNGQWNTWIDYPKFHQLVREGKSFTAEDYMAPTPSWAIVGSEERGFDPEQTRHRRTKPVGQGC